MPSDETTVNVGLLLPREMYDNLKARAKSEGLPARKLAAQLLAAGIDAENQPRPSDSPPAYLAPRLVEWLDAHFREREAGLSFAAEFGTLQLWEAETALAGRFTSGELCALLDMANGSFFSAAQTGPQYLALSMADGCALEGWAEKWEFDRDAMLAKITGLTKAESAALHVLAKAFWERHAEEDPREYAKTLAAKE